MLDQTTLLGWIIKSGMEFLTVFGNAIWVGGAAVAIYLGIKYEVKELRKDLAVARAENAEAHLRHENDLSDHEARLRNLEHAHGRHDTKF